MDNYGDSGTGKQGIMLKKFREKGFSDDEINRIKSGTDLVKDILTEAASEDIKAFCKQIATINTSDLDDLRSQLIEKGFSQDEINRITSGKDLIKNILKETASEDTKAFCEQITTIIISDLDDLRSNPKPEPNTKDNPKTANTPKKKG